MDKPTLKIPKLVIPRSAVTQKSEEGTSASSGRLGKGDHSKRIDTHQIMAFARTLETVSFGSILLSLTSTFRGDLDNYFETY